MAYGITFPYVYGASAMAIGIAMPIVCACVVLLRFMTRLLQHLRLGADDWLILAGLVAVIGMGACFADGSALHVLGYPTPQPPSDLTADELASWIAPQTVTLQKIEFAFQILMMIAYGCIKMSIVAFYRRLFVTAQKSTFGIITFVTQGVILSWSIAFILMIIFPCGKHIWGSWANTEVQTAMCPIIFTSEYGIIISDLILDVIIFVLPLPLIWSLKLRTKQKLAVSGILLLGASAVGSSIARLALYIQALAAITAEAPIDMDLILTVSLFWSLLECGLALIAACLPTLGYLFNRPILVPALKSLRSALSLGSVKRDSTAASVVSPGWQSKTSTNTPNADVQSPNTSPSKEDSINWDHRCESGVEVKGLV